jgi:hypothetical protein
MALLASKAEFHGYLTELKAAPNCLNGCTRIVTRSLQNLKQKGCCCNHSHTHAVQHHIEISSLQSSNEMNRHFIVCLHWFSCREKLSLQIFAASPASLLPLAHLHSCSRLRTLVPASSLAPPFSLACLPNQSARNSTLPSEDSVHNSC